MLINYYLSEKIDYENINHSCNNKTVLVKQSMKDRIKLNLNKNSILSNLNNKFNMNISKSSVKPVGSQMNFDNLDNINL